MNKKMMTCFNNPERKTCVCFRIFPSEYCRPQKWPFCLQKEWMFVTKHFLKRTLLPLVHFDLFWFNLKFEDGVWPYLSVTKELSHGNAVWNSLIGQTVYYNLEAVDYHWCLQLLWKLSSYAPFRESVLKQGRGKMKESMFLGRINCLAPSMHKQVQWCKNALPIQW